LLQWAMGVHSISRTLQHHLSTIFTSHHHHQPQPPTEPSNHNNMSSRPVKSPSAIRIDLLPFISVTFATSHWLRSPLKDKANKNTVATTEGRLHSQSNAQDKKAEEPWSKYSNSSKKANVLRKEANNLQITSITSPTQPPPPSQPPWITRACPGHVTSSSKIRIDLMSFIHAGDTNLSVS
jgi:hypothetical protein